MNLINYNYLTIISDVCLEAEKVLPRPCFDVSMPHLGLNVKLRYDITIHNFNPFIFCKNFKTQLHLSVKQRF